MTKFANKTTTKRAPIQTTGQTLTHEGGIGFTRDAKSDLFLLAVTNMVGESTFYESAKDRDSRFRTLIHQVVAEDPEWVARFIPFLRKEMYMRSAATVMAAEYAAAGGPNARAVVDSALQRPDEPAEILAYWLDHVGYGTKARGYMALKKGVADAARRMYSERNVLKYDGQGRGWRMADVLNVTHPKPYSEKQSALFGHVINRRYGNEETISDELLPMIAQNKKLNELDLDARRRLVESEQGQAELASAGMTWESTSGWINGPMSAKVWESIIPSMGYMALLRNLRNFDEAGISETTSKFVIWKLTDPDEVAKSMQFPFRFYSAYAHAGSTRWAHALETALDLSVQNIPWLNGSSLVMIDVSGSMQGGYSQKGTMTPATAASLFGVALAKRMEEVQLVAFATTSEKISLRKSDSTLRLMESISHKSLGGGTNTWPALDKHYGGEDRVFILTDMQSFGYGQRGATLDRVKGPIYNFNLNAYDTTHVDLSEKNRFEFGGLSDKTFTMVKLLETVGHTGWPF